MPTLSASLRPTNNDTDANITAINVPHARAMHSMGNGVFNGDEVIAMFGGVGKQRVMDSYVWIFSPSKLQWFRGAAAPFGENLCFSRSVAHFSMKQLYQNESNLTIN
jgi:hypothetical protein